MHLIILFRLAYNTLNHPLPLFAGILAEINLDRYTRIAAVPLQCLASIITAMDNRWSSQRSASGQETGEGGSGASSGVWTSTSHRPHHDDHDAEMAPMLGGGGGGGGTKGNDKLGSAFRRLAGDSDHNGKYHGRLHHARGHSCRSAMLIGAAVAAVIYLGYSVGLGGSGGGAVGASGGAGGPGPSPMVRKPKPSEPGVQVKESNMPNDDDEPSDEDAEDDEMLEGKDGDPEKDSGEGTDDDGVGEQKSRAPNAGAADDDDSVVEDADAVEDDENEDDDAASQNFADDDAFEDDGDDTEEKDGTADTAAKDAAIPSTSAAPKQDLADDDSVVDDDEVSEDDSQDDDEAVDDDGSSDDDDSIGDEDLDKDKDLVNTQLDEDGNLIANLFPGGVTTSPSIEYKIPSVIHKRFIKWSEELHQITEMGDYKSGEPKVNWDWHPRTRKERFPSVDERVSRLLIGLPLVMLLFRVYISCRLTNTYHLATLSL